MTKSVLPPYSQLSKIIKVGDTYEHYKGMRCRVIAIARHSETLEEQVVYQKLDEKGDVWVRPLEMFLEDVQVDGQTVPRFKLTP